MARLTNADCPGEYSVFAEYDGCINDLPRFVGSYESCLRYMRKYNPPMHCEWALVNCATRRCVSYML